MKKMFNNLILKLGGLIEKYKVNIFFVGIIWVIFLGVSSTKSKEVFKLLATPFIIFVFVLFVIGYLYDDLKKSNNVQVGNNRQDNNKQHVKLVEYNSEWFAKDNEKEEK